VLLLFLGHRPAALITLATGHVSLRLTPGRNCPSPCACRACRGLPAPTCKVPAADGRDRIAIGVARTSVPLHSVQVNAADDPRVLVKLSVR